MGSKSRSPKVGHHQFLVRMLVQCFFVVHAFGDHLFTDGYTIDGRRETFGCQYILKNVITEIETSCRLPFSAVFEKFIEIFPTKINQDLLFDYFFN